MQGAIKWSGAVEVKSERDERRKISDDKIVDLVKLREASGINVEYS